MQLVTTDGFKPLPSDEIVASTETTEARHLNLAADTDIESVRDALGQFERITVHFGSFADGRGFSIARRLRNMGYRGRLRAAGHVISDQFRYALDCGFDDVQISEEQAARQPESEWLVGPVRAASYRDKLGGRAKTTAKLEQPAAAHYQSQSGVFEQRVTHVEHFTDGLFSFRITRPPNFRFRSGEFAMIGLPNAARPVFRAYSIASPAWDDELEFYSIKVPNGPLTQHLQHITVNDTVLLKKKATGTLVLDALLPGRRLFLFSTGTGIAPYASIIRDPETYEKFDQIILTHTCRTAAELSWGNDLVANLDIDPIVGDLTGAGRLVHITSLTREAHHLTGRITTLIRSGAFFEAQGLGPIEAAGDRAMICGSRGVLNDLRIIVEDCGLSEGSNARPGTYVVERAFVD